GSPPRAWGRLWCDGLGVGNHRFTPTCVGTAPLRKDRKGKPAVHPHVRGDGDPLCPMPPCLIGSPPRAWGRLIPLQLFQERERFTPTCVGTARHSYAGR